MVLAKGRHPHPLKKPVENITTLKWTHELLCSFYLLFDEEQFGKKSLYHTIFKNKRHCFQPLSEIKNVIQIKMNEPVLQFEQLPDGWFPTNVRITTYMYVLSTPTSPTRPSCHFNSLQTQKIHYQRAQNSCQMAWKKAIQKLSRYHLTKEARVSHLPNFVKIFVVP